MHHQHRARARLVAGDTRSVPRRGRVVSLFPGFARAAPLLVRIAQHAHRPARSFAYTRDAQLRAHRANPPAAVSSSTRSPTKNRGEPAAESGATVPPSPRAPGPTGAVQSVRLLLSPRSASLRPFHVKRRAPACAAHAHGAKVRQAQGPPHDLPRKRPHRVRDRGRGCAPRKHGVLAPICAPSPVRFEGDPASSPVQPI